MAQYKGRIKLMLVAVAVMSVLTACGKPTAKELVAGLAEGEQNTSASYDYEIGGTVEFFVQGVRVPVRIMTEGSYQYEGIDHTSDFGRYFLLNLELNAFADTKETTLECYLVREGDEIVSYLYDGERWEYTENPVNDKTIEGAEILAKFNDLSRRVFVQAVAKMADRAAYVDKESEYYDKDYDGYIVSIYVGEAEIKEMVDIAWEYEDDILEILEEYSESENGIDGLDQGFVGLSDKMEDYAEFVGIEYILYFNKNKELVGVELNCDDFDFNGLAQQAMDELNESDEDFKFTIVVSDLVWKYFISDINETEVVVPESVKDSAVPTENLTEDALDNLREQGIDL